MLATNDSHYVHQGDAVSHDALLCVQTGSLMSDPDRFKFHGDEHYLKSAVEMRKLFAELPEACDSSLWIAERCKVDIEFGKPQLPEFPLPPEFQPAEGETYDIKCREYLQHLTLEGAPARWGDPLPDAAVERLAFELQVIADMGFSSYFLIVGDLIDYARRRGIRVGPGRGSAAGCAVAYSLRITDLDPIKYDLLFERFLNPSRKSMPDIDMDFDSRYRDEMIRYAAERYGRNHVAQIVTFSQIKARAASARRGPGARLPLCGGRQDRQGHAAAHHGTRHAVAGVSRAAGALRRRLQDGHRVARHVQPRPRRQEGRRRRPRARRLAPPRRHPRGRGGHHQRTADRVSPHPAQTRGWAGPRVLTGRHAIRDARRRRPRPLEDGLPGSAQPRRDHRRRSS